MNSLHVHTAPVLYFKRDLSITLLSTQVHCMCTPHLYYTLSVIYPSHCCLLKFTAVTQMYYNFKRDLSITLSSTQVHSCHTIFWCSEHLASCCNKETQMLWSESRAKQRLLRRSLVDSV